MNAKELFHADGRSAGVWHCTTCLYVKLSKEVAEQCCAPRKCDNCDNTTRGLGYALCDDCKAKADAKRDHEIFEKAEKFTVATCPADVALYYKEEFHFGGCDDLIEHLADDGADSFDTWPVVAWICEPRLVCLDPDRVIEQLNDDMEIDSDYTTIDAAAEDLTGLKAAIEGWNKKQTRPLWYPAHKKCVVITRSDVWPDSAGPGSDEEPPPDDEDDEE